MEPAHSSTSALAKQGVAAAGSLIGGAFFLGAGILPAPVSLALGVIAALAGIGAAFSRDKADKRIGPLVSIGGFLVLAAKLPASPPQVKSIAGTLLALGSLALLGIGVFKGVRFLHGLKQRA
ncbi:MAG: hypothetical protein LBD13_04610 [Spirochaetaceae bacterium]|jgi:hypothetical protein|nr:hypothetical protein [Spirochaetaceae bacterium]